MIQKVIQEVVQEVSQKQSPKAQNHLFSLCFHSKSCLQMGPESDPEIVPKWDPHSDLAYSIHYEYSIPYRFSYGIRHLRKHERIGIRLFLLFAFIRS